MTELLGIKIFIPLILIGCAYYCLCKKNNISSFDTFLVSIALNTILNIIFFFSVKNDGSWYDIGQSISYFCISNALDLVFMIIHFIVRCIYLFRPFVILRKLYKK